MYQKALKGPGRQLFSAKNPLENFTSAFNQGGSCKLNIEVQHHIGINGMAIWSGQDAYARFQNAYKQWTTPYTNWMATTLINSKT